VAQAGDDDNFITNLVKQCMRKTFEIRFLIAASDHSVSQGIGTDPRMASSTLSINSAPKPSRCASYHSDANQISVLAWRVRDTFI